MDIKDIITKLKETLPEKRFEHTIGVAYTAACLAMVHDADVEKAKLAGILHDNAKCFSDDKLLKKCLKHGINISDAEKQMPFLLHAKVGAYYAGKKYDAPEEVVLAVRYHTTGRPDMSILEKIIYVADYIEPMRNKAERLGEIRKMAFKDIDRCVYMISDDTLKYLESTTGKIDDMTRKTYNYYKSLVEKEDVENEFIRKG